MGKYAIFQTFKTTEQPLYALILRMIKEGGTVKDSRDNAWYCEKLFNSLSWLQKGAYLTNDIIIDNDTISTKSKNIPKDEVLYQLSDSTAMGDRAFGLMHLLLHCRQSEWHLPSMDVVFTNCWNKDSKTRAIGTHICVTKVIITKHSLDMRMLEFTDYIIEDSTGYYCLDERPFSALGDLLCPYEMKVSDWHIVSERHQKIAANLGIKLDGYQILRYIVYALFEGKQCESAELLREVYTTYTTLTLNNFDNSAAEFTLTNKGCVLHVYKRESMRPIEIGLYEAALEALENLYKECYAQSDASLYKDAGIILANADVKYVKTAFTTNLGSFSLSFLKPLKSVLAEYNMNNSARGYVLLSGNGHLDNIIGSNQGQLYLRELFDAYMKSADFNPPTAPSTASGENVSMDTFKFKVYDILKAANFPNQIAQQCSIVLAKSDEIKSMLR